MSRKRSLILVLVVFAFSLIQLYGCGGGGGSATVDGGGAPGVNGTVSGTAVKGPVANATVMAFSINPNGNAGGQIGTGTTDAQGNFSVAVGDYSGPVMLRMTGGNYMDEASHPCKNLGLTVLFLHSFDVVGTNKVTFESSASQESLDPACISYIKNL